jgi:hypothetical protein
MIPFKIGDTVEYDMYGTLRIALVTAIEPAGHKGKDVFDGISNGKEVWGYHYQVKKVL